MVEKQFQRVGYVVGCCWFAAALLMSGCAQLGTSNSQVTKCQQEKEQLLEAIRSQKSEVAALRSSNEKLASRLDEAEKEIARGPATRKFAGWDSTKNSEIAKAAPAAVGSKPTTAEVVATPTTPATDAATGTTGPPIETSKLPWKPLRPDASQEGVQRR